MKKLYRFLFTIIAVVCVLGVAAIFVACGGDDTPAPAAPKYTITLKLNEEQMWDEFTGKKGDNIEFAKESPVRPNSNFKGWSLSPNGEVVSLPTTMPDGDVTYYAIFARYYNLSLRPGDGTLEGDAFIRAEIGQSLYSLVKDVVPTAPGKSTFDGWYYGNKKIDEQATDVMPANAVSLDAKYTVAYTINIYKQPNYKSEDYNKIDADTINGTGFIGSSPRDSEYPTYTGYEFYEEKSGATSSFVLSATAENVFNAYYNLQAFSLVFNPNPPVEGLNVSGSMGAAQWGYDVENTIPDCTYAISGYRFSYWSTKADGSDRIEVGDSYKITDNSTLYAVWTRGYADITGRSYDYIYLEENADGSKSVYLSRYYLDEIKGVYDAETQTVTFKNDKNEEVLHGKLDLEGYTFTYIKKQAYVLHELGDTSYDVAGNINSAVTLTLADDGTAVCKDSDSTVNGSYALDSEEKSLKFTAKTGDYSFYFRLSQHLTDSGKVDVFEKRSDAEVGEWCRLTDNNVTGSDYADANYVLALNGYGEAVMRATSQVQSSTNSFNGYYRYSTNSTKEKPEIYLAFITSYDLYTGMITLVDRSATAKEDDNYKKFYKECEFIATAYAKPVGDAPLDIDTADSIQLDGYGLYADSATYTHGDKTVKGRYTFNWYNRTLEFSPADGSGSTTYFVDTLTVGEGEEVRTYLIYEPIQSGKSELNKLWAISGLENSYRPGVAYGFRFFNDNEGVLYIIMPDINRAFNTLNMTLQPVIWGHYNSTGVSGEYLFSAEIAPEMVNLIQLYYTQLFGFTTGLDISGFGDFKFKFTSATGGEVTALGDGYNGIELEDNGVKYVTDGYGKAKVTNDQGIVTDTRDYVLLNTMGLPCLYLVWTEKELDTSNKEVEVTKQKMYTFIDGKYRAYADEYGKYNTQYSSQVMDTAFRLVVYENDYAVLAYENSSTRNLVMYSWGKVTWADSAKKFGVYEESGVINSTGDMLTYLYGDFKFGLKEVKVVSQGKETTAVRFFTYSTPASGVVDGKFVINGANGATLSVDLNKAEAEYSVPNADGSKTTISGEFKLREGILTIVDTVAGESEDQTLLRSSAFKLAYDKDGNVTSFKSVGVETGTWQDATGLNGRLVLSGDAAATAGECNGTWYAYDRATDSMLTINGTYVRTDNDQAVEYTFKYTVEPDANVKDDDGKRSVNFAIGYDANRMPIYRIYTMPVGIVLYSSLTSTMPVYMLRGGGYSDLTLIDTYSNQTVGQLLVFPNANLMLDGAILYAFGTNLRDPQPELFFTVLGEGESARGIILDGTFAKDNMGMFECDDGRELTIPMLKDAESGEYTQEKVVVDRIRFNGIGTALLRSKTDNNKAYPVMYLRYNSNTYALVSYEGETVNIIALVRLYTSSQEGTDGETETRYIVRFDDDELRKTFTGVGHTAFITDGFSSATYADELGMLHVCTFARLDAHPEVIMVTYLNGMKLVNMYIEVNGKTGTYTVLSDDDIRIPAVSA